MAGQLAEDEVAGFSASQVRRARIGVSAILCCYGMVLALWYVYIPLVAARLGIEPATLGLTLLSIPAGSMISQTLAGMIIARKGTAWVIRRMFWGMMFNVVAITAPALPFVVLGLFGMGFVAGAVVVALNTQGLEIEAELGRPVMSMIQSFWSFGGFLGALVGGVVIGAGFGEGWGPLAVHLAILAVVFTAMLNVLPTGPAPTAAHAESGKSSGFALANVTLLAIALIILLVNLVEGSVGDWSALFLKTVKGADPAMAAAGYGLFSLAMTLFRFGGDPVVARFGEKNVMVAGGMLVGFGAAVAIFSPLLLVSAAGFLLIGIGAANMGPVIMSASGRIPGVAPSVGMATVTVAQGAGLLGGPPILGFAAQAWGLTAAIALAGIAGVIAACGSAARKWTRLSAGAAA